MDVTISLGTEIASIYGVVNDAPAVWIYRGGGLWTAVVDHSDDGVYRVRIETYRADGTHDTYEDVIYYGVTLIYNRTQRDADRAAYLSRKSLATMTDAERAEYLRPLRGAYNAEDLNRVEGAAQFLDDLLRSYGYTMGVIAPKTDWTMQDIPRGEDMARYLGNVESFRAYAPFLADMPLPDSMDQLSWQGANAIERFLWQVYYYVRLMTPAPWTSGEIMGGEA